MQRDCMTQQETGSVFYKPLAHMLPHMYSTEDFHSSSLSEVGTFKCLHTYAELDNDNNNQNLIH